MYHHILPAQQTLSLTKHNCVWSGTLFCACLQDMSRVHQREYGYMVSSSAYVIGGLHRLICLYYTWFDLACQATLDYYIYHAFSR